MKLRPWTFKKDKEVILKWIGNMKITDGQWRINAGFEVDKRIEMLDFPIATLSLLKVGAFYKDAQIMESNTTGIIYDVKIPKLNQYEIVSAISACKEVGYYLHANSEFMSQFVFKFIVEGKTYYLPHFEYIRAVFAVNKVITNVLIQPNGLELLVKRFNLNNQIAYLELSDDIPNHIVKDENFIRYFAWLYFSIKIKASFESVYMLLALKHSKKRHMKLEVKLPEVDNTYIQFRGIQKDNKFLILQWLGAHMEGANITDLKIKHKAFKKRIVTPDKRKYRKLQKECGNENVINDDHTKRSNQDANQKVEDLQSTQFQFDNFTKIHKVIGDIEEVNQGNIYISKAGKGGGILKEELIVGLDEPHYGGIIQPIDFKTLEVTKDIREQGFEEFIKTIQLLSQDANGYKLAMNFIYLPLGRKFSLINENQRRCACIVKIKHQLKINSQYIIEIAAVDGKSISTLIIYQSSFDEIWLKKLLVKLVAKNGSWSKEILGGLNCEKLKHTSKNYIDWKNRLETKLRLRNY